ncbi:MAG TPA: ankyrin repeat domain-containing protein [Fimbriimonadaceae bacterium]|nr:ankyrin repeat domain-containing protein [Fimbriimonadaceae bacterium]
MGKARSTQGARLAALLIVLLIGVAGAAYVWFNKLRDEGVISLNLERDVKVRSYADLPELQMYVEGSDWSKEGSNPQAGMQMRIFNQTKYEIKTIWVNLKVYRPNGSQPIFHQERMLSYLNDMWTQFGPTLIPGGMCLAASGFALTTEARDALNSGGHYELDITRAAVYDSPSDMSKPGHLYTLLANKNIDAFRKAIEHDPSLARMRPMGGITPAHIAAGEDLTEALDIIVEHGGKLNTKSGPGETPLHTAARCGATQAIQYLVEHGLNVNEGGRAKQTPLILATLDSRKEAMQELINLGADVNSTDADGFTSLHLAAQYGTADMAKILISAGAKIDPKTKDGDTPLYVAVAYSNLDVAKLLVKNGANVRISSKEGDTLLHMAASRYDMDTLKYCLSLGLSKSKKNKKGQTPLDLAKITGRDDFAKLLKP